MQPQQNWVQQLFQFPERPNEGDPQRRDDAEKQDRESRWGERHATEFRSLARKVWPARSQIGQAGRFCDVVVSTRLSTNPDSGFPFQRFSGSVASACFRSPERRRPPAIPTPVTQFCSRPVAKLTF